MAAALDRNVSEPEFAALVALDWGNGKHAWAAQDTASGARERGKLEARPEEVDAWMTAYLARYPGRRVAVALEQKRGALLYSFMKYEQVVLYPIHGATASKFRAALYPSGSKDDPQDADLLLDLLTQHRDHIRRLDPDTGETRKLQLLVEKRRKLVKERTWQSNRLTDVMAVHPEAKMFQSLPGCRGGPGTTLGGLFRNRSRTLPQCGRGGLFHRHCTGAGAER